MVKLILMPKFEHQCARRIAYDDTCVALLPMQERVRIAICQDGRTKAYQTALQHEADYFNMLYQRYLGKSNIRVECYSFSLAASPETLQEQMSALDTTDIFYMTGFSAGHNMSEVLRIGFANHTLQGGDEQDQSNLQASLLRKIKARVQYNQMVYMGTCGGACCAGKTYWCQSESGVLSPGTSAAELTLFDFCMGVSLHYDVGTPPRMCDTEVIDCNTFQITGGAALAVHIEGEVARASSFMCGKNNSWWQWCETATARHKTVVEQIAMKVSGPWYHPSVGVWCLSLNGSAFSCGESFELPD